jgi:hypothetical protein
MLEGRPAVFVPVIKTTVDGDEILPAIHGLVDRRGMDTGQFASDCGAIAGPALVDRWQQALVRLREASLTMQSWLWAPPAKHSTRQMDELLERIEVLYQLDVQHHLRDHPDDLLRRYARRLASRPPSAGRMIVEPGRTIEVACFIRYSLQVNTDRLLLMVGRRVADLVVTGAQPRESA